MSIVMVLEIPGGTTDQYDRANEIAGIHGPEDAPEGLISHTCAVTDDGLVICDVWRSEEDLDSFLQTTIGPAMQQVGAQPSPPRIAQVHNHLAAGD